MARKAVNLHEKWMEDEDYRHAHFEEEPLLRVAIHLIRFRNEAALTQEELANRMGKQQSWISRVEAGQENITLRTLGQFAYAFDRDPADFLLEIETLAPATA